MTNKKTWVAGLLLMTLIALTPACEDTGITAPEGSTISVTPTPGTVLINSANGETRGSTSIVAQVIDAGGLPLKGVPIFFSTDGGLMGTVDNFCSETNTCTRDGALCLIDSDCDPLPPDVIETNTNGIVTDILTLRLLADPDSVTVTAKATNMSGSALVTKAVNEQVNPVPVIVADPTGGQRAGVSFNFNGSTSQPGALLNIECYQWELNSGAIPVFDALGDGCEECPVPGGAGCTGECTERGIDTSNLTITVGQPGEDIDITLGVKLKVSNIPNVTCNNQIDPGLIFGQNVANISDYRIQCDPTDPSVDAGPSQTGALDAPPLGRVDFVLSAQGFDPESTNLAYRWTCTNAVEIDPPNGEAQTVTCSYTSVTAATATVTVTNECGRTNSDGLTLTVLQN